MEKSKGKINEMFEKIVTKIHGDQNEKVNLEESVKITGNLLTASRRFKSVRRAMRRGHITEFGIMIPKRPFNNRANTSKRKGVHSRFENLIKKRDYEAAKAATDR